jgi:hypothetical protein
LNSRAVAAKVRAHPRIGWRERDPPARHVLPPRRATWVPAWTHRREPKARSMTDVLMPESSRVPQSAPATSCPWPSNDHQLGVDGGPKPSHGRLGTSPLSPGIVCRLRRASALARAGTASHSCLHVFDCARMAGVVLESFPGPGDFPQSASARLFPSPRSSCKLEDASTTARESSCLVLLIAASQRVASETLHTERVRPDWVRLPVTTVTPPLSASLYACPA